MGISSFGTGLTSLLFERMSWYGRSPFERCMQDDGVLQAHWFGINHVTTPALDTEISHKCISQETTPVKINVVLFACMWVTDFCSLPVNEHVWWRLSLWHGGCGGWWWEVSLNPNFTKDVSSLCVSLLSMSVNKIRSLHLPFLEGI